MVVNTTKKKKQTNKRLQKTRLYVTYRGVFKVAYVDLYIHIYNIYIYINGSFVINFIKLFMHYIFSIFSYLLLLFIYSYSYFYFYFYFLVILALFNFSIFFNHFLFSSIFYPLQCAFLLNFHLIPFRF